MENNISSQDASNEHTHLPRLIAFDLDDTLVESKQPLDPEMAALLRELLEVTRIAVISGGHLERMQEQFLPSIEATNDQLRNLTLAPTCGMSMYQFEDEWNQIYRHDLTEEEKSRIRRVFDEHVFDKLYSVPEVYWGEIMEDRKTMFAFAGLGSTAPVAEKRAWDPDGAKRMAICEVIRPHLDDSFEVRLGGTTTIDITRKGVDKAYGMYRLEEHVGVPIADMLFIGDALYENGNDFPVISTGVRIKEVKNHHHTKDIIRELLSQERCPECGIGGGGVDME